MKDNFNRSEKKIIKVLTSIRKAVLLTSDEKNQLKIKITDKIANLPVTKPEYKRYKWWLYKLNIKGVTMPFIPIIIAVLLAGGAGTAVLADSAKPGDALYGLDRAMERIQEKLTTNEDSRFNLGLQHAHERLGELRRIHELPPSERKEVVKAKAIEHVQFSLERIDNKIEAVNERIIGFEDDSERIVEKVVERSEKVIERLEFLREEKEELIKRIETDEVSPIPPQMQIRLRAIKELAPQIREEVKGKVIELRKEYLLDRPLIKKSPPFKGISGKIQSNRGIIGSSDVTEDVLPYDDYFDQGHTNSQSGVGQTEVPQIQAQIQSNNIDLDV